MKRLDLDDLPPRIAQLLAGLAAGEDVLLVQGGVVAGRIIGAQAPAAKAEPEPASEERAAEIFENFRSAMEDEF